MSDETIDEVYPFKYNISSYGADYTVDGLVKRLRESSILIPSFQRSFVWSIIQSSRFIESLLLGLPVPGVFFSREEKSEKLLVIDGQQRLSSLLFFYNGEFANSKKLFVLTGVQKEFEGKTYKTLKDEDRRKLDDSIIHATIIKQDVPSNDDSSIYFIFERLNTGGMALTSQEIRSSIYRGPFNDLLKKLNENKDWRYLYGKPHARLKDQEAILRFFALYSGWKKYKKTIKVFLNTYMATNINLNTNSQVSLESIFANTVKVIRESIGIKAFRLKSQPTVALIDAVMVGVAIRLEKGPIAQTKTLSQKFDLLLKDKDFIDAITTSTSDEVNVNKRISKAIQMFSDVE